MSNGTRHSGCDNCGATQSHKLVSHEWTRIQVESTKKQILSNLKRDSMLSACCHFACHYGRHDGDGEGCCKATYDTFGEDVFLMPIDTTVRWWKWMASAWAWDCGTEMEDELYVLPKRCIYKSTRVSSISIDSTHNQLDDFLPIVSVQNGSRFWLGRNTRSTQGGSIIAN